MNAQRSLSVEILRDIQTPDVPVEAALWGLEKMRTIAPSLEIVSLGGLIRVNESNDGTINTGNLPAYAFHADYNIIVTGRRIFVPPHLRSSEIPVGSISTGTSFPSGNNRPFALVDGAQSRFPANTTMHEMGHLLRIPNRGRHFDGVCHCKNGDCVMHREVSPSTDFCNNCTKQLARSVFRLLDLKHASTDLAGQGS